MVTFCVSYHVMSLSDAVDLESLLVYVFMFFWN